MAQVWPTFPILGSRLVSAFRGDFNSIIDALVTCFEGPTQPSVVYSNMFWADTSANKLKQRNKANTNWNIVRDLESDYGGAITRAGTGGSPFTGDIDMGGKLITGLAQGSGNGAARVSDLAAYAKLDGSTPFTGVPSGPNQDPSSGDQLTRKSYVDAKVVAGGAYTGQITMATAPAAGSNQLPRQIDLENVRDTHTHSGAVGAGTRVKIQDLVTTSLSANRIPRTPGDGGGVIMTNLNLKPFSIYTDLPTLFTETASPGWQTHSLTGLMGSGIYYAVALLIESTIQNDIAELDIKFRKTGTTPTVPQRHRWHHNIAGSGAIIGHTGVAFVEIDPAVRTFDYNVIKVGTVTFTVRLLAQLQMTTVD